MTTGGQFLRNDRGFRSQLVASGSAHYVWRAGRTRHMLGSASGNTAIVPQTMPWPYSADLNGITYPSGLVGVQFTYDPFQPDPVAYNKAALVAVPATLPSGYTFRPSRDHAVSTPTAQPYSNNCQQFVFGGGGPGSVSSDYQDASGNPTWFLRTPSGLSGYNWFPENQGQQCIGNGSGGGVGTIIGGGTNATPVGWFTARCAGCQYYRLDWNNIGGDTLRIDLVCNADGSNTQPGDTVLSTYTASAGTGLKDTGLITGPFRMSGTHRKGYLGFRLFDITLSRYVLSTFNLRMGPILDIPFPWTCYGVDAGGAHIVAPGGV